MRSVYAHFPINTSITENSTLIDIRNFLGEKYTRQVRMIPGVTIYAGKETKDELILEGNDIELVSRSGKKDLITHLLFLLELVVDRLIYLFLNGSLHLHMELHL